MSIGGHPMDGTLGGVGMISSPTTRSLMRPE